MSDESEVTVKYKFDPVWGGILMGYSLVGIYFALYLFNIIGVERDLFEYFGKLGALVEDGYNHQREIE